MFFLLWWIIVGLIAGWVTAKIMHSHRGWPMDIVVGIVGAIIGGWIMRALGAAAQGGMIYTVLVAILGAIILTLIVRAFEHVSPRPGGTPAAPRI